MSWRSRRNLSTCGAFVSLGCNGLLLSFMGTSLPSLQAHLGMNITEAGMLMAVLQVGFTLFTLAAGILSDLVACSHILVLGCALSASGSLLLGRVDAFGLNALLVFSMGAGIGAILSGSNSLLIKLFPEQKASILNIHHVFFGLGAFAGPVLMGHLITSGNLWQGAYLGSGCVLLVLSLIFVIIGHHEPAGQRSGGSFLPQVAVLLTDRRFMAISVVNGLSMGAQVTIMLLGVSYLIDAKQLSLAHAGYALSGFSILLVIGRGICSRLTTVVPAERLILGLLVMQIIATLLIFMGNRTMAMVALALSGLAFSGVYPTLLALAGGLFPRVSGAALGMLSTLGGVGTVVLCWLTGYVAGRGGIQAGFFVLVSASCIATMTFLATYRVLGHEEPGARR